MLFDGLTRIASAVSKHRFKKVESIIDIMTDAERARLRPFAVCSCAGGHKMQVPFI